MTKLALDRKLDRRCYGRPILPFIISINANFLCINNYGEGILLFGERRTVRRIVAVLGIASVLRWLVPSIWSPQLDLRYRLSLVRQSQDLKAGFRCEEQYGQVR